MQSSFSTKNFALASSYGFSLVIYLPDFSQSTFLRLLSINPNCSRRYEGTFGSSDFCLVPEVPFAPAER